MPTECSAECFDFGNVEDRPVEAAFDGGLVTSDAGALLLGATDRAIGMIDRFAGCFHDVRRANLIEHSVATLVGQRVFAIALGYEDLPGFGSRKLIVTHHDENSVERLLGMQLGKHGRDFSQGHIDGSLDMEEVVFILRSYIQHHQL